MTTKQQERQNLARRLADLGISAQDVPALLHLERRLHRWYEGECGGEGLNSSWCIERDATTGQPYRASYFHTGHTVRVPIRDEETAAEERLIQILAKYPGVACFLQTDPRGCALYLYRIADLDGRAIESCYSSIGGAVWE